MLGHKDENLALIRTFKDETAQRVEEGRQRTVSSMAVFLALGLVFGIGISLFTGYRTSQPIRKIVALFRDVAEGEGDLTRRLPVDRADELGEQAKWFNAFVEKIRQMVAEVADITDTLNHSSGNLSDCAGRVSKGNGQMKNRSNTAAAATEEMSVAIRITRVIHDINDIISTISAAMEQQTSGTRQIADSVSQASLGLKEINEHITQSAATAESLSEDIGQVDQEATRLSDDGLEVDQSANALLNLSNQLKTLVGRFVVN